MQLMQKQERPYRLTFAASFPGLASLVEQNGSDQDDNFNQDPQEELQGLPQCDDLHQGRREFQIYCNATDTQVL